MLSRHLAVLAAIEHELRMRIAAVAAARGRDQAPAPAVSLGPTRDASHGDFATAVALAAGKMWRVNPMEVAGAIAQAGVADLPDVARIDIAKPGFINLTMTPAFWARVVAEALERGDAYGTSDALAEHSPLLVEIGRAHV